MAKLKISNLVYEPLTDLAELARRMERVASLGYDGIELTVTHPFGFTIEQIQTLSKQHALPVVSLLSGWSYGAEGLCLSSPDANVRDRAVDRLIGYARQAVQLDAVLVVGLMQGLLSDEPDAEKANDRIVDCFRRVCGESEDFGATIVIEPVNHLQVGFNHNVDEVIQIIERVGSPALTYMLDTIHLNIEERDILECIRLHGPRVRHFHLCETNGGPFGSAGLNFKAVLATLHEIAYQHYVSVKVYRKTTWDESVGTAMEFLLAIPSVRKSNAVQRGS